MEQKRVKAFISYSWDGKEHEEWVLKLATDLIGKYGIKVILDQFELSAGKDLPYFMERSIEESDKVIVILTPTYKEKADKRKSGVGYEGSIISQELFESPITNVKFIPVLRVGDKKIASPKFLQSKVFHSMVDDNNYDFQLLQLVKTLYDKSLVEKPLLGPVPNFNDVTLDPLISKANSVLEEEKLNKELDNILSSPQGLEIALDDIKKLYTLLKEKTEIYKSSTGLNFNFQEDHRYNLIVNCLNYSVSLSWTYQYSNSLTGSLFYVWYYKGYVRLSSNFQYHFPGEEPKIIIEEKLELDLNYDKKPVWKTKLGKKSNIEQLSNKVFTFIIDNIQKDKQKSFRK